MSKWHVFNFDSKVEEDIRDLCVGRVKITRYRDRGNKIGSKRAVRFHLKDETGRYHAIRHIIRVKVKDDKDAVLLKLSFSDALECKAVHATRHDYTKDINSFKRYIRIVNKGMR